ncbi:hypothetical protein C8R43DRAFT_517253 [Mycena crocata]|nr:hypothetical protein C8R43DRAFT_517253 [Mycena crocata]
MLVGRLTFRHQPLATSLHRIAANRSLHSETTTAMSTVNKTAHAFDKTRLDALLNRRFFYAPAFEIYGGVAGLYDYGPPGSSLQANIIAEWRRHFIVEESMLELDTTIMTPSPVFEASGHVARFADWMVKDTGNGEVLRADHLVKNVLEARLEGDREARGAAPVTPAADEKKKKKKQVKSTAVKLEDAVVAEYESILAQLDNYSGPELGALMRTHTITNPSSGNPVGEPQQFNLMFASSIGPTGQHPGLVSAHAGFLNGRNPRILLPHAHMILRCGSPLRTFTSACSCVLHVDILFKCKRRRGERVSSFTLWRLFFLAICNL